MTKSLWLKRTALLMCLLVLFLCLVPGFQQRASAIALVDDVALFIIGFLAVSGISLTISQGGLSGAVDWVVDKFNDYLDSLSLQLNTVLSLWEWVKVRAGLSTDPDSSALVSGFCDWLVTDQSIVDNSSIQIIQSEFSVGGYDVFVAPVSYVSSTGYNVNVEISSASDSVYFWVSSNSNHSTTNFGACSLSPFVLSLLYKPINSSKYYTLNITSSASASDGIYTALFRNLGWAEGRWSPIYVPGIPLEWLPSSAEDISVVHGATLDSGVVDVPVIPADQSLVLFIPGVTPYDTISDALLSLEDTIVDGALDDIEDSVITLPTQPEYVSQGLSSVFPFCIPFDLYHFFDCLAADPVAPSFEIPFVVDGLVDYTFQIDLSAFESVAQVLRIMELLLFCIGLALVTRNLIRG